MDEYGEVKGGENYPKINSYPRSGNHFKSLMSETWEYELLISINFRQHENYNEPPARLEGGSRPTLKCIYFLIVNYNPIPRNNVTQECNRLKSKFTLK